MSVRRIVFHIGVGKTGTSSIQTMCAERRDELARRGICYPDIDSRFAAQHGLAPLDRERDPVAKSLFAGVMETYLAGDFHTLLISTEQLCFASKDLIAFYAEQCAAFDTNVSFYARRQDELIESAYLQGVVQGKHDTDFWAYIEASLKGTAWDFMERLAPWDRGFGASSISCRIYHKRLDVRMDFLASLGIDPGGLAEVSKSSEPENSSIIHDLVPLIRLFDASHEPISESHREEFIETAKRASLKFKSLASQPLGLSQRKNIVQNFIRSNKMLAERYNIDSVEASRLLELEPF